MKLITHLIHKVILAINEINEDTNYASKIAKKINSTFPATVRVLNQLTEGKIIELKEIHKRRKILKLTKKGKEIQKLLIKLKELE